MTLLTAQDYCNSLWEKRKRSGSDLDHQLAIPPRLSLESFQALSNNAPFVQTSTDTIFHGDRRNFILRDGKIIVEDEGERLPTRVSRHHVIDTYTPVFPVRKIEIAYTEGYTSLNLPIVIDRQKVEKHYKRFDPNTTLSRPEQIWSRANYILSVIAMNSTADLAPGCYCKTDIVITWANDQCMKIRFDLTAVHGLTQKGPSIARHLLEVTQGKNGAEWAEALAGLELADFWGEPGQ